MLYACNDPDMNRL